MKKIFTSLTVLLLTLSTLTAQDYKEGIIKEFDDYFELLVNGEYEKSLDYLIDEIFEIVPKEMLVKVMEQTFNDPEINIKLDKIAGYEIKKPKLVEGKYYAAMNYTNRMFMKPNLSAESEEDKQLQINMFLTTYNAAFGKGSTLYNEEKERFEITADKKGCAISENGKNNWKFLTIEENQKEMLEMLLPKKVIKKVL